MFTLFPLNSDYLTPRKECLMSSTTDGLDSMDRTQQPPPTEGAECEARLRHVLAYISEKRSRRWIAFTAVFLLIHHISGIPFGFLYSFTFDVLEVAGIGYIDIFSPGIFGLTLLTTTFLPPLIITLFIFSRLRRIYRGY